MRGIDKVGQTALAMAAVRAKESDRPNSLFQDPLAQIVAASLRGEVDKLAGGVSREDLPFVEIRTRFFDDYLQEAANVFHLRQIVLVAAGLDSRSFRFAWPEGVTIYELDRAAVLDYKEDLIRAHGMTPKCRRVAVPIDLSIDNISEALRAAGFDPAHPTAWLLEGLVHYLHPEEVTRLVQTTTRVSADRSRLGMDLVNADFFTSHWTAARLENLAKFGAPWYFGHNDPRSWLAQFGWKAVVRQPGDEGANYGRWSQPVVPLSYEGLPRMFLVKASLNKPAVVSLR